MPVLERNPTARPSAAQRLRAKIDADLTSDKVAFPDPAAAPLGTDDEAAGAAAPRRTVTADEAVETDRPVKQREGAAPAFIMVITVLVCGLAIAGSVLLR